MLQSAVLYLGVTVWLFSVSTLSGQPADSEHREGYGTRSAVPASGVEQTRSTSRPPAAQYSPLAAAGGYNRQATTWYDTVFLSLNPKQVNWGDWWEQRRSIWLDNVALNSYFWFSFSATVLLLLSWFALAVQYSDRLKERRWLAEAAADAKHYAEFCKGQAVEAITRYNAHVEKCNRVIESGESGLVTPETANLSDLKRELDRLRSDNDAKTRQVQKLDEQLKEREEATSNLMVRIAELEKSMGSRRNGPAKTETAGGGGPNAALIERINRLERELTDRNEQIRRLQGG